MRSTTCLFLASWLALTGLGCAPEIDDSVSSDATGGGVSPDASGDLAVVAPGVPVAIGDASAHRRPAYLRAAATATQEATLVTSSVEPDGLRLLETVVSLASWPPLQRAFRRLALPNPGSPFDLSDNGEGSYALAFMGSEHPRAFTFIDRIAPGQPPDNLLQTLIDHEVGAFPVLARQANDDLLVGWQQATKMGAQWSVEIDRSSKKPEGAFVTGFCAGSEADFRTNAIATTAQGLTIVGGDGACGDAVGSGVVSLVGMRLMPSDYEPGVLPAYALLATVHLAKPPTAVLLARREEGAWMVASFADGLAVHRLTPTGSGVVPGSWSAATPTELAGAVGPSPVTKLPSIDVATLADGGLLVAWFSTDPSDGARELRLARLSAAGKVTGTLAMSPGDVGDHPTSTSVALAPHDGRFAVFVQISPGDGAKPGVFAVDVGLP